MSAALPSLNLCARSKDHNMRSPGDCRQPGLAGVCEVWRLAGGQRGLLRAVQHALRRGQGGTGGAHVHLPTPPCSTPSCVSAASHALGSPCNKAKAGGDASRSIHRALRLLPSDLRRPAALFVQQTGIAPSLLWSFWHKSTAALFPVLWAAPQLVPAAAAAFHTLDHSLQAHRTAHRKHHFWPCH